MNTPRKQSGSFVIEALISVLLFAVGLISMMMIAAQGTNQIGQAKYRNDASYLAGELIGEMWVSGSSPGGFDRTAWNARVTSMLPNGDPSATSVSGTTVSVDIAWSDPKNQGVTHHYRTTADIVKN